MSNDDRRTPSEARNDSGGSPSHSPNARATLRLVKPTPARSVTPDGASPGPATESPEEASWRRYDELCREEMMKILKGVTGGDVRKGRRINTSGFRRAKVRMEREGSGDIAFWSRVATDERLSQGRYDPSPRPELPTETYVKRSALTMYRRPSELLGEGIDPPGALAKADAALRSDAQRIGLHPDAVLGRYVSGRLEEGCALGPDRAAEWREREAAMVMRAQRPDRTGFSTSDLAAAAKIVDAFHTEAQARYDAIQRHRDAAPRDVVAVALSRATPPDKGARGTPNEVLGEAHNRAWLAHIDRMYDAVDHLDNRLAGINDAPGQRRVISRMEGQGEAGTAFWEGLAGSDRDHEAFGAEEGRRSGAKRPREAMYRRPSTVLGEGIDPQRVLEKADAALKARARQVGLHPDAVLGRYLAGSYWDSTWRGPVTPAVAARWRQREIATVLRSQDPDRTTFTKSDLAAATKTVEAFHREAQARYDAIQLHRNARVRETPGGSRDGPDRSGPSRDGGYGL